MSVGATNPGSLQGQHLVPRALARRFAPSYGIRLLPPHMVSGVPRVENAPSKRKAFVLPIEKPLLRWDIVLSVAKDFSVPCAGEPCDHHFLEFPIWWVRAQGFEP